MSTRDSDGKIILDSWTRDTITPAELEELSRADKVYLMTAGECDDRDWCKCYRLADGRMYAINEGVVLSAQDADGNEIPVTRITDDEIHGDGMEEEQLPCYRCPWIDWCERCDEWCAELADEAERRAERKAAAVALGRRGGKIGGKSRSEAKAAASRKNIARVNEVLTAEERSERARTAASMRWPKVKLTVRRRGNAVPASVGPEGGPHLAVGDAWISSHLSPQQAYAVANGETVEIEVAQGVWGEIRRSHRLDQ